MRIKLFIFAAVSLLIGSQAAFGISSKLVCTGDFFFHLNSTEEISAYGNTTFFYEGDQVKLLKFEAQERPQETPTDVGTPVCIEETYTTFWSGKFLLEPKIMHNKPISGEMSLLFGSDKMSLVNLKLDEEVKGKDNYQSKEQEFFRIEAADLNQVIVVFKLDGPPHKWYFVGVANKGEDIFDGTFYKVKSKLEDIVKEVGSGIREIPTQWKKVGMFQLNEVAPP
ncbi:MAG: hypothetical protein HYS98_04050 [Deltaproteobacteria bacterium]|nr:hypothetical protein [Deltaproteobacteria bacterium]